MLAELSRSVSTMLEVVPAIDVIMQLTMLVRAHAIGVAGCDGFRNACHETTDGRGGFWDKARGRSRIVEL